MATYTPNPGTNQSTTIQQVEGTPLSAVISKLKSLTSSETFWNHQLVGRWILGLWLFAVEISYLDGYTYSLRSASAKQLSDVLRLSMLTYWDNCRRILNNNTNQIHHTRSAIFTWFHRSTFLCALYFQAKGWHALVLERARQNNRFIISFRKSMWSSSV